MCKLGSELDRCSNTIDVQIRNCLKLFVYISNLSSRKTEPKVILYHEIACIV